VIKLVKDRVIIGESVIFVWTASQPDGTQINPDSPKFNQAVSTANSFIKGGNVGHASMTLDANVHISWWPSKQIEPVEKAKGVLSGSNKSVMVTAVKAATTGVLGTSYDNLQADIELELGNNPDIILSIAFSEEQKVRIRTWWGAFVASNPNWNATNQSCAKIIRDAFKIALGDNYQVKPGKELAEEVAVPPGYIKKLVKKNGGKVIYPVLKKCPQCDYETRKQNYVDCPLGCKQKLEYLF